MDTKFCQYCQCDHPLTDEWWECSRGKLCTCKIKRSQNNKTQAKKEMRKKYYDTHKDKILAQKKQYNSDNRAQIKDKYQEYCDSHKTTLAENKRQYYLDNKDHIAQYRKEYCKRNKDKKSEYNRKYSSRKRTIDVQFKLRENLRCRTNKAIQCGQKAGSAVRDLGCSVTELKQYLESKFQDGMNWDNWGVHGWHIDHIIPLASFDLTDRKQFLKACHYTNLQPLWASENWSKSSKITN